MEKIKRLILTIVTTAACLGMMSAAVKAAPCQNEKFSFSQPDESKVDVIATGDEFYLHLEDEEGYTLVKNNEGFICYANLNEDGTELEATDTVYTGDSSNVPEGLEKHLEITQESIDKKVEEAKEKKGVKNECALDKMAKPKTRSLTADNKQEVVGLTVLIDFSDEPGKFSYDEVNNFLNQKGYNGYGNKGSVRDFFYDISGGELDYSNKIAKSEDGSILYYRAKNPKSYYDDDKKDCAVSTYDLIKEINAWLEENKDKIDLSGVSKNTDGTYTVLNLLYAGKRSANHGNGLWPHKDEYNNQVYEITDMDDELTLGTICHENGHALLGYDDMYNDTRKNEYGKSGPLMVGDYCLMGYGANNEDGKNPAPPNPYLRYIRSGFKGNVTDLNSINDGRQLSLKANDKGFSDVYKLTNPDDQNEYMFVENIQKNGRYSGVSNSGLVVWRGSGSSRHQSVKIVYADNPDSFSNGLLFSDETVNVLNRVVTPNAKWDNEKYSELKLSNISDSKDEMTFQKGCTVKPGFYNVKGEIFDVINENGETAKGIKEVNSKKYYFNKKNGNAALGRATVDGKDYYFDEVTGEMVTGFVEEYDMIFYYDKDNGELQKGWFNVDGKEYYGDKEHGYLYKGLVTIDNKYYCFDQDGVYQPDKKGFVLVGDYKVMGQTDYNLDCSNQSTIGNTITFKAGIVGDDSDDRDDSYTYEYSISYRAAPAPAEVHQLSIKGAGTFWVTLKNQGYCLVTVKATGTHGNVYEDSVIIEVNPEFSVKSFNVNNKNIRTGGCAYGKAGEEACVTPVVDGGYIYDHSTKSSCVIEYYDDENYKLQADETKVYKDISSELKWTPQKKGVYKLKFKVQDLIGNISEEEVWYEAR